jgi:UDP-2-acetamido-2,6-beta-L-arabino-hexul-4-ose reductase
MKILITGSNGFIGKHLKLFLSYFKDLEVINFDRGDDLSYILKNNRDIDFVFHLAGENRPKDRRSYYSGNTELTRLLAHELASIRKVHGKSISVIFTSSIQIDNNNDYGRSKLLAEELLIENCRASNLPLRIFRLPNVFGKWANPNYNSVVATFCYNISRGIDIRVDDPDANLRLVFIDDVVEGLCEQISKRHESGKLVTYEEIKPTYSCTVGSLAKLLYQFQAGRPALEMPEAGYGFIRDLYSTYISYLPQESFSYTIPLYKDERGIFSEIFKSEKCGQISYFTAMPGVSRGNHYHHTKIETFLVIKGVARFKFRDICTGENFILTVSDTENRAVHSIPGWAHEVTNIGSCEMIVLLWANETFNRLKPDTYGFLL